MTFLDSRQLYSSIQNVVDDDDDDDDDDDNVHARI